MTPHLNLGRVIAESLALSRRRWVALTLILAAWWALSFGSGALPWPKYTAGSGDALGLTVYEVRFFAFLALGWIRETAIVAVALQPEGRDASAPAAVRAALGVFIVLLPYRVVADALAVTWNVWRAVTPPGRPSLEFVEQQGAFALLAEAVYLLLIGCWGVIAPVAIAERTGPDAAFSRSWKLLAGNRWRLVALAVLMLFVGTFPSLLISQGMWLFRGNLLGYVAFTRYAFPVANIVSSILGALWLVMTAVAYQELRRLKEGAAPDDVAHVFA